MNIVAIAGALAAAVAAAAVVTSPVLASGESKNEPPFTRPASIGGVRGTLLLAVSPSGPVIRGEPKNEAPFTSPAGERERLALALREVDELAARPVGGESSGSPIQTRSFSWVDAGLSALATLGICLAGLGAVAVRRSTRAPNAFPSGRPDPRVST